MLRGVLVAGGFAERMRPVAILHAPSPLGLKPQLDERVSGVRRAPAALRAAGLHDALGVTDVVEVPPPPYIADRHPVNGLRNVAGIVDYSVALADALGPLLDDEGAFPLVLGGDCSILLGTTLALRRRGRFGLVYIDAHPDYLTIQQTETGGVAGLPLALATGLGPDVLTDIEHRRPYIAESDAVAVASRDDYQIRGRRGEKRVEDSSIRAHDLEEIRARSPRAVADGVMRALAERDVDGVWIHVDVDALDSRIMPAVDSPEPDGLSRDEAAELLSGLLAHPLARGLQVTIYDADRDPDGSAARLLAGLLVDVLAPLRAIRA